MSTLLPPEILNKLKEMSENKPPVVEEPKAKGRPVSKDSLDGEGNPVSTCSVCNTNKIRKFVKKLKCGVRWYVNENNRRWRGKKCPDCAYKEHLDYMRKKRKTKKPRV